MSIELTRDQARALAATSDAPPTVTDPTTRTTYVLLRSDEYDRVKGLLAADDPDALYPLLAEIDPEDWENGSAYGIGPE